MAEDKQELFDGEPISYKNYCRAVQGLMEGEEMRFSYIMIYLPKFQCMQKDKKKEVEDVTADT